MDKKHAESGANAEHDVEVKSDCLAHSLGGYRVAISIPFARGSRLFALFLLIVFFHSLSVIRKHYYLQQQIQTALQSLTKKRLTASLKDGDSFVVGDLVKYRAKHMLSRSLK